MKEDTAMTWGEVLGVVVVAMLPEVEVVVGAMADEVPVLVLCRGKHNTISCQCCPCRHSY